MLRSNAEICSTLFSMGRIGSNLTHGCRITFRIRGGHIIYNWVSGGTDVSNTPLQLRNLLCDSIGLCKERVRPQAIVKGIRYTAPGRNFAIYLQLSADQRHGLRG